MTLVNADRALGGTAVPVTTRVVTLTPAPAIDRIYVVESMHTGAVNRAVRVESHLAGKGINVARALYRAGGTVIAVTPLNLENALAIDEPSLYRTVTVPAPTRVNTVVISENGMTTNINEAAAALGPGVWARLCDRVGEELQLMRADWLVVGGTMPADATTGDTVHPAALFDEAHRSDARICLDSGPDTIVGWIDAGYAPDLIKPNVHELSQAVSRPLRTMGDVQRAARQLIDRGVGVVLASLGQDGALVVTSTSAWWAHTPPAAVVNTTGAGDSALAGLLSRWDGSDEECLPVALTTAVSWGYLAVGELSPVPSRFLPVSGVEVRDVPSTRPLS